MSLWPFSSSTSNIAWGSAWETTASMLTAGSFWSPSSRSTLRAFGVRVPRRGPLCLPKTFDSLRGEGGHARLELSHLLAGQPVDCREAAHRFEPARVLAHSLGDEHRARSEVARMRGRHAGPEAELDVVGRELERLDAFLPGAFKVCQLVQAVGFGVGVVGAADLDQPAQLAQRFRVILDAQVDRPVLPRSAAPGAL